MSITVDDDQYVRNEPYILQDASSESITVPTAEGGTATVEVADSTGAVDRAIVQLYRDGATS